MKIIAAIYKSKVKYIHNVPDNFNVKFDPKSFYFAVDVTNENPVPEQNWKYDFQTGDFFPPDPVAVNPIKSKEFLKRFTGNEREAFLTSVDVKVQTFWEWLKMEGDIDLTDALVMAGVQMLENKGVIGAGRAAEILVIEEV